MIDTGDKPKYLIKPLAITQHPDLSFAEQDYLCLIWQLRGEKGCIAGNHWLGEYFGVSPQRSSEVINSLKTKKIIRVSLKRRGKLVIQRTIDIIDKGIKDSFIGVSRNPLEGIKDSFTGYQGKGVIEIKA